MEVFRICKEAHSTQLKASGSANRWNLPGQQVIYAGTSRSLSTLELVVHRSAIYSSINYKVMVVSISDNDHLIKQINTRDLPNNWQTLTAYSTLQKIGSNWYSNNETLILKVPSTIITQEYNFIINTEHPDFKENVQLARTEDYFWDNRLL